MVMKGRREREREREEMSERARWTETPATRCINTRCIESPPNSVDCVV